MNKQERTWFKVAALAAGLVGTAIGVATVVKKKKEHSERIQFDSFEDELLMDAVEVDDEINAAMADTEESSAEVVSQTKPIEEIGVIDDLDDDDNDAEDGDAEKK